VALGVCRLRRGDGAESRRKLFGRIAAERAQLCAYHFPFPGTGFVAAEREGFRFVPVDWSGTV
jgi:hypothetical protein